MNPGVIIEAHRNGIVPKTEFIYEAFFFLNPDVVANALDSINYRTYEYMDCTCFYYQKSLLKSNTILSRMLKNFHNTIEYALHWARDEF